MDTWFTSGMDDAGSKDIMVGEAFVPQHRLMAPTHRCDWQKLQSR
jgi:hypothetical protein